MRQALPGVGRAVHRGRLQPASALHLRVLRSFQRTARGSQLCGARPFSAHSIGRGDGAAANALASAPSYEEAMRKAWLADSTSVHSAWAEHFSSGAHDNSYASSPPSAAMLDVFGVAQLARAFRTHGFRAARVDPLNLQPRLSMTDSVLDYRRYGLTDLSRSCYVGDGIFGFHETTLPVGEVVKRLQECYCGPIGVEYDHVHNEEQNKWIRLQFEGTQDKALSNEERIVVLDNLAWADGFEKFLKKKFGQDKRFGLDGAEMLVPLMKSLIDESSERGVDTVVMCMPHRGRLNVLANVLEKPLPQILQEFEKKDPSDSEKRKVDFSNHSGDVKYHLGTSCNRVAGITNKRFVHLALLANPSHLEAVNPVIEGKVRAKQDFAGDSERKRVMAVQLHGDAAFAGQGIVSEVMQMSGLEYFTTGGTIHIVANNQIGFTTLPFRSARGLCTDIAKGFNVPILHVNADDPEAVIRVARMAAEWRATFKQDIVIDLVCFRRYGHNELDEPKFTQPLMYDRISKHPDTLKLYSDELLREGVITAEFFEKEVVGRISAALEEAFIASPNFVQQEDDWLSVRWKGFRSPAQRDSIKSTGVPLETLVQIGSAISTLPERIKPHAAIKRDLSRKHQAVVVSAKENPSDKLVDWGTAESLAFGTLLLEGIPVRLSGQDVERGTFSHRHAVVADQETGETYVPLNHITNTQAKLQACNSLLSEYGVLGFENGYALENPNALVIWEAQFGDFSNSAQIMIDQFIASGETKWKRQCGLVLLLPHGYDGQGPEHSSARLERFLELCDGDADEFPFSEDNSYLTDKEQQIYRSNLQVVNCSTPASYFHVLRRQIHRTFRKPLIIMAPKKLLRLPECRSAIDEFDDVGVDTRFARVKPEEDEQILANSINVKKLVLCSGNVYFDLLESRSKRERLDVALVRVEQLAPFPWLPVQEQLNTYPNAEVVWCQEEPRNMGAWTWMEPRLRSLLKEDAGGREPVYVGRRAASAPAVGSSMRHLLELREFIGKIFDQRAEA